VLDLIDMVGLTEVAGKRAGAFSLGMGQRLGIAATLLGDPATLILDEPVNGLDPDGILWIRNLLKGLAAEGRTVFVSSHLMSEMALTADHLIVIGRGKLIAAMSVEAFVAHSTHNFVRVRTPDPAKLLPLLGAATSVTTDAEGTLLVTGLECAAIGDLAANHNIALHELAPHLASLEEAFMEMTHDSVDYHADAAAPDGLVRAAR
jgi:ABC-2 type transport system ATP-binding protein